MKQQFLYKAIVATAGALTNMALLAGGVIPGADGSIKIAGDPHEMNWALKCDGSQYEPVKADSAWGTLNNLPASLISNFQSSTDGEDIVQTLTIKNTANEPVSLKGASVNFPFNDNYTTAEECVVRRCNAHLWPFGSAAWACLIRMGGKAPHLGWMLTKGEVNGYAVSKRDQVKGHDASNFRGVFSFLLPDRTLAPGEEYALEWRLFSHEGWDDFKAQLVKRGGLWVEADRYVAQVGETVSIAGSSGLAEKIQLAAPGETNVVVEANGKWTKVELFAVDNYRKFIERRLDFVLDHQQYLKPGDIRDGAFLPYDNETNEQYFDWLAGKHRYDMDEGRERMGMGIALAEWIRRRGYANPKAVPALKKYASFIRRALIRNNWRVVSEVNRFKHRIYNYAWTARFFFDMYDITGEEEYLECGYQVMMAAYRFGGYNFYMIEVPVKQSIEDLRNAGWNDKAEKLLGEYRKVAANFLDYGITPPKFEMYYEQSIIAPGAMFLAEMFLVTKEEKYKKGCEVLLPALEAFNGHQPSCHLNDVGIRHWDGYWFGKKRLLGDTFPHYWSCITADFFGRWAEITGDKTYAQRASDICKANLLLFTAEGRGGCVYIYPDIVNGKTGRFLEPMANDENWALAFAARWLDEMH